MKKFIRLAAVFIFILSATSLFAEDITLESEVLKLVLHEKTGSYSLYRKTGAKGKLVALNEISDNSSSTFFAVKTGSHSKVLTRSYKITQSAVRNEDGSASLIWEEDLIFKAEACFSLVSSEEGMPADTVRVDFSLMNLADANVSCAVKAVVDTVLGETSRIHFTTAKGTAIRTEKGWESMVQDKWLSSSNGRETVSFILAGSAATDPEYVLAASRDILLSDTWKPAVNEGRALNTLQSPNNSALGIWFQEKKLAFFESATCTFFMTTAADGEVPPNGAFIGMETEPDDSELSESTVESASQIVDAAVASPAKYEVVQTAVQSSIDYAYIQLLLDRIKLVEQSDDPDIEEINKLSDEIDAVILELTK